MTCAHIEGDPPPEINKSIVDNKVDLLISAATLHLDRVKNLSDRAWNADVLFWGSILISGSTLIGFSAKTDNVLSDIINERGWLIISGYYIVIFMYFFLMYANKHRSLVTERNRYQLCQDEAFSLRGLKDYCIIDRSGRMIPEKLASFCEKPSRIIVGFEPIKRRRILISSVWGAKLLSTLAYDRGNFCSGGDHGFLCRLEQGRYRKPKNQNHRTLFFPA